MKTWLRLLLAVTAGNVSSMGDVKPDKVVALTEAFWNSEGSASGERDAPESFSSSGKWLFASLMGSGASYTDIAPGKNGCNSVLGDNATAEL